MRKQRQKHVQGAVPHILFLLVSYNRGPAMMEQQRGGAGVVMQRAEGKRGHKCKKKKKWFCFLFSFSIKRRHLMRFHGQVWFTLAPIHCLRDLWRLKIFTLPNRQPLCPPTGLVNLFSTFVGVTKCISSLADFRRTRCRRAEATLQPPPPLCLC